MIATRLHGWGMVLTLALASCGTLPNDRGWGADATLEPGGERLRRAAERAMGDPGTWLPAAGAVVVYWSGADQRLSDWAREEMPVFGSTRNAADTSDDLRDYTDIGLFTTALLTPSGPSEDWVENKARGVGVEALAVITTSGVTNVLKETVRREQPGGESGDGHESFVSNHATEPFARAALIRRNTDHLGLPGWLETGVDGSFYVMAAGSAWARVEAGLHFPSDQLAGAAIGNFIALFMHDAFLGLDDGSESRMATRAAPGPMVVFDWWW